MGSGALFDLAEIELRRFEIRLSAQSKVKKWSSTCTLFQSLQTLSCNTQLCSTDLMSIFIPEGQPDTSKLLEQESLVDSVNRDSVKVNGEELVVSPRQASDNLNNEQLAVSLESRASAFLTAVHLAKTVKENKEEPERASIYSVLRQVLRNDMANRLSKTVLRESGGTPSGQSGKPDQRLTRSLQLP